MGVNAPGRRSSLAPPLVAGAVAIAARLAIVGWAASRFPPAADGTYYHALAVRLAQGLGYTWAWPDGAVTAAAHYPVGYPAMLAAGYWLFGPTPTWGMILGALFGAAAAVLAARLVRPFGDRASLAAGLLVALHPALVPYAPALMTEAVAGALLLCAAAAAFREGRGPSWRSLALAGVVMGVTTLVRPQLVVLAPVLGFVAVGAVAARRRFAAAALVLAVAIGVVLPWTIRNCKTMGTCALVSVNGGWNLLIGAQTESGAWQELDVPPPCRTVWDEAAKDECFARAARAEIAAHPIAALRRVPAKLAVTFDYFGGAPWYLHESNPRAFTARHKTALGTVDAIASRLVLLLALFSAGRRALERHVSRGARVGLGLVIALAVLSAVTRHAAPAYLALVMLALFGCPYAARELVVPFGALVVASVALTHAAFFGAGRYGLVAAPLVAAMAGLAFARRVASEVPRCQDGDVGAEQAIAGSGISPEREESPSTIERDAG